jgi:hypothetical protein
MRKTMLYAALAVATLCGCSTSEVDDAAEERVEAQILAGVNQGTRATGAIWEADDAIGVLVTGSSLGAESTLTALYPNQSYTLSSGANSANGQFAATSTADKIYFQSDSEVATFAAYYPYAKDADGSVAVSTLKNQTAEGQKTIDLLYASGATASKKSPTVSFTGANEFQHVMSKLGLTITLGTGFDDDTLPDDATVTLGGLIHEGALALTGADAGKVVAATGAEAVSDWDITSSYGELLLIPQDLSQSPLTLTITVGGQTFTNTTSLCPNLQPGTSYTYNITVTLSGMAVSGSTISDWTVGEGGEGNATL